MARSRQPRRPHFIPEWAAKKHYAKQADLAKALGADKSVVSRWYSEGQSPGDEWQEKLADLFECTRDELFRHPNDVRISQALQQLPPEEQEKVVRMVEAYVYEPAENDAGN